MWISMLKLTAVKGNIVPNINSLKLRGNIPDVSFRDGIIEPAATTTLVLNVVQRTIPKSFDPTLYVLSFQMEGLFRRFST